MSDNQSEDMLNDYHKANKLLKAQNQILKQALETIHIRVRANQTQKNEIQKLLTLDSIKELVCQALEDIKQVK